MRMVGGVGGGKVGGGREGAVESAFWVRLRARRECSCCRSSVAWVGWPVAAWRKSVSV